MFTDSDIQQIKSKGASLEQIEAQVQNFKSGFPFMEIVKAAIVNDGIISLNQEDLALYTEIYENALKVKSVVKFVPASGAATRMFKSLFEFINHPAANTLKTKEDFEAAKLKDVALFFENLNKFAFVEDLKTKAQESGYKLTEALAAKEYVKIAKTYLEADGLNYGNLPKGLLQFHKRQEIVRTPVEEHLTEAALYASNGIAKIHFTVSPEHRPSFVELLEKVVPIYEKRFGITYQIDMSEQKSSTDTIAVDLNNEPFRNANGSLVFRPAGHGALIENLNEIDADLIFIKNIDNVVPGDEKEPTVTYKKALAGILISVQRKVFEYLKLLQEPDQIDIWTKDEMGKFLHEHLFILPSDKFEPKSKEDKIKDLIEKLNRPIRVCGMVKNEGEPGGGPFWAVNPDHTVSLQIVESSQIDSKNTEKMEIMNHSTHFNPVDLVCSPRTFDGGKFDLRNYTDPKTGFISLKSKDGKDLKAQELPGLWNGAMSNWNTIFVEVPIQTFTPVKTVNDLLRPEHQ
jgi:hypothetical protein